MHFQCCRDCSKLCLRLLPAPCVNDVVPTALQLLDDVAVPVVVVGHSDTEPEREPEPVLPRGLVGLRNVGARIAQSIHVIVQTSKLVALDSPWACSALTPHAGSKDQQGGSMAHMSQTRY